MNFSNKIVVITGASGGIGHEMTARFLKEGAIVCAADLNDDALKDLSKSLDDPKNLFLLKADISKEDSCQEIANKVKDKYGAVDILINNAGWFPFQDFEEITYDDWQKVLKINLDGNFLMTKAFLPLLKVNGTSRIINIASGSFLNPPDNQAHYVAAKAGVIGFTRALAMSLGKYNITVNAITPGLTATKSLLEKVAAEMVDKIAEKGALKRRQKAEDLIGAVVFLASDDAAFISGQTLNVDGGRNFI